MLEQNISILCWNVRGLNCPDRRATVHETIATSSCHLVCLQETKLQVIDSFIATYLGGYRQKNFAYKPADGTKGGILLLWDDNVVNISNVQIGSYFFPEMLLSRILRRGITSSLPLYMGQLEAFTKTHFFSSYPPRNRRQGQNGWLMGTSTRFTGPEIKTTPMLIIAD